MTDIQEILRLENVLNALWFVTEETNIIQKQLLVVVIHVKELLVNVLGMKSRVNAIPVISETIERENAINALKLFTIVNSIKLIVLLNQKYVDFLYK
jgi:hypothetical protein